MSDESENKRLMGRAEELLADVRAEMKRHAGISVGLRARAWYELHDVAERLEPVVEHLRRAESFLGQ